MPRLNLSVTERLMLSNQYRILEALHPNQKEEYAHAREAVESGYELNYDWICEHIYSNTLSPEACEEVLEALDMHWQMQSEFAQLEDKADIDPKDLRFPGYDGNNEGSHMGYADYLINRLGKWTDLDRSKTLNSHSRKAETYRRMAKVWKKTRLKDEWVADDIKAILEAGYPSI